MQALATVAACAVLTACASDGTEEESFSARFVERTVYRGHEDRKGTVEGSFDWTAREGSAVESGLGLTHEVIQIDDVCFDRFENQQWRVTSTLSADSFCPPSLFVDPRQTLPLLRSVAESFRFVGTATLQGIETTRYRGRLANGPVEVWTDVDGVVRKIRLRDERKDEFAKGYTRTREYFDFGVEVDVSPPVETD
jgi:hypothetical protein